MVKLQFSRVYSQIFKALMLFILFLFSSTIVSAQEQEQKIEAGKFGILAYTNSFFLYSMGGEYNNYSLVTPWIGCIYHAGENILIKPAFMLGDVQQEAGNRVDKNEMFGLEMGLFYCTKLVDNMSLYYGTVFTFQKIENSHSSHGEFEDESGREKTKTYGVTLCVGGQYMFNARFGLFADVGIGFSQEKQTYSQIKSTAIVTRGGNIGAVFYTN